MEIQSSFESLAVASRPLQRRGAPFGSAQCRLHQVAAATAPRIRDGIAIASSPHCKHLSRMTLGFRAGLVPDLWQQEAVRALQQGKDPPSPRLRRDKRGGSGGDSFKIRGHTALLFRP
jgi:hypothetical protein